MSAPARQLTCPCYPHADQIQKVSSVVPAGTFKGQASGETRGEILSRAGQVENAFTGKTISAHSSQTEIASRLAMPDRPRYSLATWIGPIGCAWCIAFVVISVLGVGGAFLFRSDEPTAASAFFGAIVIGIGVGLVIAVVGLVLTVRGVRVNMRKWDRAKARWDRLYYCHRDDGVFDPDDRVFIPTSQLKSYLFR